MRTLSRHKLDLHYVVLKIGDMAFSTKRGITTEGKLLLQITESMMGGEEYNLRLGTKLVEGTNHVPLEQPVFIELDIYFASDGYPVKMNFEVGSYREGLQQKEGG